MHIHSKSCASHAKFQLQVRYEVLGKLLRERGMLKQVGLSLVLNWLVGPALMTGLAWAFLPDLPGYRNGVILVRGGAAT